MLAFLGNCEMHVFAGGRLPPLRNTGAARVVLSFLGNCEMLVVAGGRLPPLRNTRAARAVLSFRSGALNSNTVNCYVLVPIQK